MQRKRVMKGIAYTFFAWCALSLTVRAQDTLILDDGYESVVSGVVTDTRGDTITIANNENEIQVELDNLDLDRGARDLIQPGMRVTVEGRFKDFGSTPEFEAQRLLRHGNMPLTGSEALLLNEKDRYD